jgi:SAM-dependent methyltransferase
MQADRRSTRWLADRMTTKLREILERRVRELPPGRYMRQRLARASLERFADGRPLRVLDAGCGEGLLTTDLGRRHPSWTIEGVDISEDAILAGRALASERRAENVTFRRGNVTNGVGNERYDAVAALECLLEIQDDEGAVASLAGALRPGGLLVLHVPERDWKPLFRTGRRTWKLEVRHGYGREEIVELVERAGLRVHRVSATTRGMLQLAEEARDRVRGSSLRVRALALPLVRTAVLLERTGITWGPARAFHIEARKPMEEHDSIPGAAS